MSDTTVAAPATEVVAPASADAPVQTPAAEVQPTTNAPLTRREASQQVIERIRASQAAREAASVGAAGGSSAVAETGAVTSPVIDNTGRAHDPANGQFTTPPAADAAGAIPPAATPQGSPPAEVPAALPQSGRRVEISADHPLRGMGLDAFDALNETQERAIRALLNGTYTRPQEVATLREQMQAQQTEVMRLKAQLAVREQWNTQVVDDGTMAEYEAIKAVNPAAAERYLRGAQAELQTKADEEFAKLDGEAKALQQQEAEREGAELGQRIASDAYAHVRTKFPVEIVVLPHFEQMFVQAQRRVGMDVAEVEAQGHTVDPAKVSAAIVDEFKNTLLQNPQARAIIEAKRSEKAAQQSAAERERIAAEERTAAEAAARATAEGVERQLLAASRPANNPVGNPGAVRAGVTPQTTTGNDAVPVTQLRRSLREEVRQLGRAAVAR
jgi:hypothetical protein